MPSSLPVFLSGKRGEWGGELNGVGLRGAQENGGDGADKVKTDCLLF